MSVLIGCSPSTGSSLLRRMLDRHSEIFCGSETSLFAKPLLYTDWKANKAKLSRSSIFGLNNGGWHNFIGVDLSSEYLLTKAELRKMTQQDYASFPDFSTAFYKPVLKQSNASLWIEKTPSNAFTLELFLNTFNEGRVIHIVRDPLDVIASLHNRGMDLYNAVAVCLLNMAAALETRNNPRSHLVKYETLISEPTATLKGICHFLGLPYQASMLEPRSNEAGISHMEGWQYDEREPVKEGSIGRFVRLEKDLQTEIRNRASSISVTLPFEFNTISRIREYLYSKKDANDGDSIISYKLRNEMRADIRKRHFSISHFKKHNYPLEINHGAI